MSKRLNLVGQKFNHLTVVSFSHMHKYKSYWICRCSCGITKTIRGNDLQSGRTLSCGCYGTEIRKKINTTHGMSKSKLYYVWLAMKARCDNTKNKSYMRYGGRGISVCKRWYEFDNFFIDMGLPPTDKHSIDRIDNNGNYAPENCRWATKEEQLNNTTKNIKLTYNGKTLSVSQWERLQNFNKDLIGYRIRNGWSSKDAITTPPRQKTIPVP